MTTDTRSTSSFASSHRPHLPRSSQSVLPRPCCFSSMREMVVLLLLPAYLVFCQQIAPSVLLSKQINPSTLNRLMSSGPGAMTTAQICCSYLIVSMAVWIPRTSNCRSLKDSIQQVNSICIRASTGDGCLYYRPSLFSFLLCVCASACSQFHCKHKVKLRFTNFSSSWQVCSILDDPPCVLVLLNLSYNLSYSNMSPCFNWMCQNSIGCIEICCLWFLVMMQSR